MNINDIRHKQYMHDDTRMLRSVEINPTELCNRTCTFCPRHDTKTYPNKSRHIQLKTLRNICKGLLEMDYTGRVGFVGFGEPLLHEDIYSCVNTVRDMLPRVKWLEINTNGDKLTRDVLCKLYESGCSHVTVSMYDNDRSIEFDDMSQDIPLHMTYRHHYDESNNYNLNLVNRHEMLTGNKTTYNNQPCYIPFYKMMIDWNGDVMLCNNDWNRTKLFGNVNNKDLYNIWFGQQMNSHRKQLLIGRNRCVPCKNCSVDGQQRGIECVNIYHERFENS